MKSLDAILKADKEKLNYKLNELKIENEKWNKRLDEYRIDSDLVDDIRNSISKFSIERENINQLLFDSKLLEFKPIKIEQINIYSLSNFTIDNFENKIDISKQIDDLNKNFDFCYLNKRAEYLQLKSNFYVEYYAFFFKWRFVFVVQ